MPALLLQLAAVLALLLVCSFAPGFLIVRRLRWTPLEKVCGSVGLSLILLYLGVWAVFCLGPGNPHTAYLVLLGLVILAAAVSARDAWLLFRTFRIRKAIAGFGFLLVWTLTMLAMIRVYSGAGWYGDWLEHFHRSLFFLHRLPLTTTIFPSYAVPARPPLMNVLAAFFLGLTEDRFELFQVVFGFLNTLAFLPAYLLLPALGVRRRTGLVVLAVLFAANPVVMENASYTWTKALPAFYVILAVALYLAGLRKRDGVRIVAAFVALTAGLLAHYSVGPYLFFLTLHFGVSLLRERFRQWREAVWIAALCGLLAATWFGWSLSRYGTRTTVGSNTSVESAGKYNGSGIGRIAGNVFDTVVPGWLRGQWPDWPQSNPDGATRDRAFVFYQLNLIFAMGVVGGPLVIWLLYRFYRKGPYRWSGQRGFWLAMIPFCVVVGIAVVGERDSNGVPHLTLLAMEMIGLIALAGRFRSIPGALRVLLLAGCVLDFYFGVYLQARMESLENAPDRIVFADPVFEYGSLKALPTFEGISGHARDGWVLKHRVFLSRKWLNDLPRGRENDLVFRTYWPKTEADLRQAIDDDAANWQGWMDRHGGSVTYLGDHVAGQSGHGVDFAAGFFVVLFTGLLCFALREAAQSPEKKAAPAKKRGVTKVKISGR